MITILPADITAMLAYVGTTFTELSPIVAVAVGLPLSFWVIRKVIGLVKFR